MESSTVLPSLESTMSESMFNTFTTFMMEAITATISDVQDEGTLVNVTGFFDRMKHRTLSMFFSPTALKQTVSEVCESAEVRSFVLSTHQRFISAVSIAELHDVFQTSKDTLVQLATELHSEDSLLSKALAFSEMTPPDNLRGIVDANGWLVVLYLCQAFGTFDDALFAISERAPK